MTGEKNQLMRKDGRVVAGEDRLLEKRSHYVLLPGKKTELGEDD